MLNVNAPPFVLDTVGLNAYADPTLIDVMGRPEIVGPEPGAFVAVFPELVGGGEIGAGLPEFVSGIEVVTCEVGAVSADP
jgi:hypothetical protein